MPAYHRQDVGPAVEGAGLGCELELEPAEQGAELGLLGIPGGAEQSSGRRGHDLPVRLEQLPQLAPAKQAHRQVAKVGTRREESRGHDLLGQLDAVLCP
jgi:hypothetical protein